MRALLAVMVVISSPALPYGAMRFAYCALRELPVSNCTLTRSATNAERPSRWTDMLSLIDEIPASEPPQLPRYWIELNPMVKKLENA